MKSSITSTTPECTLSISTIFQLSWIAFKKNPMLWFVLAIAVHFVSLMEMAGAWEAIKLFSDQILGINITQFTSNIFNNIPENQSAPIEKAIQEAIHTIIYSIILQLVVAQLVYDVLSKKNKELVVSEIGNLLQNNLLINLLRTVGISIVYLLVLALQMVFIVLTSVVLGLFLSTLKSVVGIPSILFWAIAAVLGLLWFVVIVVGSIYLTSRLSLAEPVLVNENTSVLGSFTCSWRYTAICRMKMCVLVTMCLGIFFVTEFGVASLILVYLPPDTLGAELPFIAKIVVYIKSIMTNLVFAILFSVSYFWLRNDNGDGKLRR